MVRWLQSRRAFLLGALCAFALAALPGISFATGNGPAEHAAERTFVVTVPGLGPMLLVGHTQSSAVRSYVDGLIARRVFPRSAATLRAWAASVERAPEAPSLESLHAQGRAVIGIQLGKLEDLTGEHDQHAERNAYARAIREAGGVPVFIPPADDVAHAERFVASIDHLLLPGGNDIAPSTYHQRVNGAFDMNRHVDRFELAMVQQAIDQEKGVDGICRGAQMLNVAHDRGTLVQEIRGRITYRPHRSTDGSRFRHPVRIEPDSELARVVGDLSIRAVVSSHHQAFGRPGRGVRIVAWSPDGVPEALEARGGRVRGYQFHVERSRSAASRAIFRSMVNRAAATRSVRPFVH
jgi:putative glutamine amidotransferase